MDYRPQDEHPLKNPNNAPKMAKYGPDPPNLPLTPLRAPGSPDPKTFCPPIGAPLPPKRAQDTPQPARQPTAVSKNLGYKPQYKYPGKNPNNAPKLAEYGPEHTNLALTPLRPPSTPDPKTFCPPIGAPLPPQRAQDTPQPARLPTTVSKNLGYKPRYKYPPKGP